MEKGVIITSNLEKGGSNMKDFNKMIEEQIRKNNMDAKKQEKQAQETAKEEALDEMAQRADKELRFANKMLELYEKFFLDTTLVSIIENQIKNMTCEEDRYKTFKVSINYNLYRVSKETIELGYGVRKISSIRGMYVSEPDIGETLEISGKDVTDGDMELVSNVLPKWTLLENLDSFYTYSMTEKYNSEGYEYIMFTFTTSLQKLIDMYYVEKERQEERIRLNNGLKK